MIQILTADDVWKCKISIRRMNRVTSFHMEHKEGKRRRRALKGNRTRRKHPEVPELPATLGDFTLGQLRHILNTIYAAPFKKRHIISFPSDYNDQGRGNNDYIVDVETGSSTQEDSSDQD